MLISLESLPSDQFQVGTGLTTTIDIFDCTKKYNKYDPNIIIGELLECTLTLCLGEGSGVAFHSPFPL